MRRQMFGEVVGAGETFTTHVAMVRPLARMDAQMARQVALPAEGAPAEEAHEGTLAGVLPHVELQVLLGTDAFATERTGEATLTLFFNGVGAQETYNGRVVAAPEDVQALAGRDGV